MKNICALLLFLVFFTPLLWKGEGGEAFSQNIAINTTGNSPATGSGLDIDFSSQGLLIPRVSLSGSTDLMGNVSLPTSLIIYKKDVVGWASAIGYYYWDGTQWVQLGVGSIWATSGNTLTGTLPATPNEWVGTVNAADWIVRTNNTEKMRVSSTGKVGIGTTSPSEFLHFAKSGNTVIRFESGAVNWTTGGDQSDLGKYKISSASTLTGATRVTVDPSTGNVGIGTTSPDASALMEITSASKGLLIPSVALTATNASGPVTSPANSLLVYNTATAGVAPNNVVPGYYSWTGTYWQYYAGIGWLPAGNPGTVDGTNFIGTKDDVSFNIRVNNQKSGKIESENLTVTFGNTYFGYQTLTNLPGNQGSKCVGVGYQALQNNSRFGTGGGSNLTAIGCQTLSNNTTCSTFGGDCGTSEGVGYQALFTSCMGYNNVAIGAGAMYTLDTREYNTAIGYHALYTNTYDAHVAVGWSSQELTQGSALYNTSIGSSSLKLNTTGTNNLAVGARAGQAYATGSNNVFVGYNADASVNALTNANAFGNGAIVNASNKVRFGNAAVTVVEGPVAYTVSDGRFKENVTQEVRGLDFVNRLRPVVYNFDTKKFHEFLVESMPDPIKAMHLKDMDYAKSTGIRQSGFIAQEVEKALKQSGYDFNGLHKPGDEKDNYSLAYGEFVIPLVKAVQELSAKSNDQQKTIEALESKKNDQFRNFLMQMNIQQKSYQERQLRIEALQKTIEELKQMSGSLGQIKTNTATGVVKKN